MLLILCLLASTVLGGMIVPVPGERECIPQQRQCAWCVEGSGRACEQCFDGYALVNGQCVKCQVPGCSFCATPSVCNGCQYGLTLYPVNHVNTTFNDGGYYYTSPQGDSCLNCTRADPHCLACSAETAGACTLCAAGRLLNNGNCQTRAVCVDVKTETDYRIPAGLFVQNDTVPRSNPITSYLPWYEFQSRLYQTVYDGGVGVGVGVAMPFYGGYGGSLALNAELNQWTLTDSIGGYLAHSTNNNLFGGGWLAYPNDKPADLTISQGDCDSINDAGYGYGIYGPVYGGGYGGGLGVGGGGGVGGVPPGGVVTGQPNGENGLPPRFPPTPGGKGTGKTPKPTRVPKNTKAPKSTKQPKTKTKSKTPTPKPTLARRIPTQTQARTEGNNRAIGH